MIAEDKDRLECLRLAVQIFMPKANGTSNDKVADMVVDTAVKFYKFATKGESK